MSNIGQLAQAWLDAKREEDKARVARLLIEDQLVAALDIPNEGSKTHKIDGYKITATQPVARKVDPKKWEEVKHLITPDMAPVKVKIEADSTGCKWLAENDPIAWRKIASAFEAKPGKVGFKVEKTE